MSSLLACVFLFITGVLMYRQSDYDLKFTRLELVTFDERFVGNASAVTFKYNRTQAVANLSINILVDMGYQLMVRAQAYKFASNEYRQFPIRIMFGFCDAVAQNDYGFGDFYNCGNFSRCPMKKGNYLICNWATNSTNFPPHIPNGDYMVEVAYVYKSIDVAVYNTYVSVTRKCCKYNV